MIRFLIELFVFYIIYKFVFELMLPVYNTTKQIKKKMNEMNDQYEKDQKKNSNYTNTDSSTKKDINHDYIDYEEVK